MQSVADLFFFFLEKNRMSLDFIIFPSTTTSLPVSAAEKCDAATAVLQCRDAIGQVMSQVWLTKDLTEETGNS